MINPDDIESLNYLNAPTAAALYGSEAANGVLMITTKKGREGKMAITVSSNVTFDNPLLTPDIQNVYGASVTPVRDDAGNITSGKVGIYSWGPKVSEMSQYKMTGADGQSYLGLPVTMNSEKFPGQMNNVHLRDYAKNDLDDFYRTGVTTNNSIALSGGTDKMSSYFSSGNSHSDGMLHKNS